MSTLLVVVAGAAGRLGRLVTNALLEDPAVRVRLLVRDAQDGRELGELRGERREVVAFDAALASEAERASAVAGAFSVVSTMQGGPEIIVDAQLALLRAAKAAGARRFLPSDYSIDFFKLPPGVNVNSDWRRTLAERAADEPSETFEVVHLMQGMFADRGVLGFLRLFDADARVLRYWGDGRTPLDWTTWEDTARFIAAAARDPRKVPARLFVLGERMDLLTFGDAWEAAHGTKLTRERLGSLEELAAETERVRAVEPANMGAWLALMYARSMFGGRGLLGPAENARYPEIVVEDVRAAIARGAL